MSVRRTYQTGSGLTERKRVHQSIMILMLVWRQYTRLGFFQRATGQGSRTYSTDPCRFLSPCTVATAPAAERSELSTRSFSGRRSCQHPGNGGKDGRSSDGAGFHTYLSHRKTRRRCWRTPANGCTHGQIRLKARLACTIQGFQAQRATSPLPPHPLRRCLSWSSASTEMVKSSDALTNLSS